MNKFGYPKYGKSQRIGKIGESFINNFVHKQFEWLYRSVPQESDFGIDGYVDIITSEYVTGQSIALQIKCGDTYYNKQTEGGIKYEGENKHLNYYINSKIPMILIVLKGDCSEGKWVEFSINMISQTETGWWIEIPGNNYLDLEAKKQWNQIAGPTIDNSELIKSSLQFNKKIDESDFGIYTVPKEDVVLCNFQGINDIIERLSRNKKSLLKNRGTLEVLIDGYNEDSREAYEIPEIRRWYSQSLEAEIPWFYFIGSQLEMMEFKILLFCYCDVKIKYQKDGNTGVEITNPEKIPDWMDKNFINLNIFTEKKGISLDINKEMSTRATSFVNTL